MFRDTCNNEWVSPILKWTASQFSCNYFFINLLFVCCMINPLHTGFFIFSPEIILRKRKYLKFPASPLKSISSQMSVSVWKLKKNDVCIQNNPCKFSWDRDQSNSGVLPHRGGGQAGQGGDQLGGDGGAALLAPPLLLPLHPHRLACSSKHPG